MSKLSVLHCTSHLHRPLLPPSAVHTSSPVHHGLVTFYSSERPAVIDAPAPQTIEDSVEHAKRAFALKKYEQAVDYYATALELATEKYGEDAPESADLYFAYGKALLENAISQASVLGKEQQEDEGEDPNTNKASGSNTGGSGPILSFSGDAEDADDIGAGGEDVTVDLFADAVNRIAREEAEEADGDEEGDEAEPEDDFNAAWEVLDLARAIYDKGKDENDEVKLKLADTYITLGDISLETEKFDQAITDYEAGLSLKHDLLPFSSRQIAEAHYKLSMVLDLTSGRLKDAIIHAEKALTSVEARAAELRDGLSGQLKPESRGQAPVGNVKGSGKGKGKGVGGKLVRDDLVQNMTKTQIEGELKELEELKDDLALKVEELKTAPSEPTASAPALVAKALDQELNAGSSKSDPAAVNDLTSMVVKKKKKASDTNGAGKRKADGDAGSPSEKKTKLEDAAQS
ncbi:hypothetical protein PILCRDRAFT_1835 [Piloderma croceum F 1598]|uniref:Tetratricopeptide SHNi-TPR domain-containing protein n=1 Tax=Piloderma croceum (strain F 1598) TaxID=765440 RepID=A0A0C3GFW9_PILCF|nr:hypothetical protein PILCRDRAFT_1835 [Piloderma croceum F 1598]